MTTRSRAGLVAALLLLAGCGRGFSDPASAGEPEPELLGDLSGYYKLSAAIPAAPAGSSEGNPEPAEAEPITFPLDAALGLMHLRHPAGGLDPVVGMVDLSRVLPRLQAVGGIADLETFAAFGEAPHFLSGAFDGRHFTGEDIFGVGFEVVRVAGGAALRVDTGVPICPGGPRYVAQAEQICTFDPSLSGVYVGTSDDCEGGDETRAVLALGFTGRLLVGMRWPDTTRVLNGAYDRFAERGSGITEHLGSDLAGAIASLRLFKLELHEDRERVHIELRVLGANEVCEERLRVTRRRGGEAYSCALPLSAGTELRIATAVTQVEGGRALDVRVLDAARGSEVVDADHPRLSVVARASADGAALTALEVPAGVSARFALPAEAPPKTAPARYEILAQRLGASVLDPAALAAPLCFNDARE